MEVELRANYYKGRHIDSFYKLDTADNIVFKRYTNALSIDFLKDFLT